MKERFDHEAYLQDVFKCMALESVFTLVIKRDVINGVEC